MRFSSIPSFLRGAGGTFLPSGMRKIRYRGPWPVTKVAVALETWIPMKRTEGAMQWSKVRIFTLQLPCQAVRTRGYARFLSIRPPSGTAKHLLCLVDLSEILSAIACRQVESKLLV